LPPTLVGGAGQEESWAFAQNLSKPFSYRLKPKFIYRIKTWSNISAKAGKFVEPDLRLKSEAIHEIND
jgi:hypothetical protein